MFAFSNQTSDDSSGTSGNTIRALINIIPSIREMDNAEKEKLVKFLQPIARKIAHFTLYTIGGIVIILNFREYNILSKYTIMYSALFGFLYSISDEIHQIFIPRQVG